MRNFSDKYFRDYQNAHFIFKMCLQNGAVY